MSPAAEYLRRVAACDALVTHWDGRPFAWGQADCAILAAQALWLIRGVPPLDPWPDYHDPKTALAALRAAGFRSIAGALNRLAGKARRNALEALPGDILVGPSDTPHFPSLGVALTDGRALWPAGRSADGSGCFIVGRTAGVRAWSAV